MRILFVTTTFSRFAGDSLGGSGNSYFDLYSEIAKKVEKVDVVAPLQIDSKKLEIINNLTIYREWPTKSYISFESMIKTKQILKIPFIIFSLYKRAILLAKENDYDIIHGFFIVPAGLIVSLLPGSSKKVISALGSDVHTLSYFPFISSLYKWIMRRTDGVIYNTSVMEERLNELQAQNLQYVPTPINRNIFRYSPRMTTLPKFVFIGRLTKEKGVEILLKSFMNVLQVLPNSQLTVIGDGPERNSMLNFINTNKIQNYVRILGAIESSGVAKNIRESYALLLPSFKEGMPAAVLETMSVGRAIVATNVGDLGDLVTDEVGYLTNINDVEAFSRAIIKVFRKEYSTKKIRDKTNKFSMKRIAKSYIKYYESQL